MTTPEEHARPAAGQPGQRRFGDRYVIAADRVFDGTRVLEGHTVAVAGDRIAAVAPAEGLSGPGHRIRFAGTLLPGFIDLHAHLRLGQVPPEVVLRHGLTTIRETGGPHLGLAPLGQLIEGAPADLIGVRGNPLEQFKPLEYPDLVVSGGVTIAGLAGH